MKNVCIRLGLVALAVSLIGCSAKPSPVSPQADGTAKTAVSTTVKSIVQTTETAKPTPTVVTPTDSTQGVCARPSITDTSSLSITTVDATAATSVTDETTSTVMSSVTTVTTANDHRTRPTGEPEIDFSEFD